MRFVFFSILLLPCTFLQAQLQQSFVKETLKVYSSYGDYLDVKNCKITVTIKGFLPDAPAGMFANDFTAEYQIELSLGEYFYNADGSNKVPVSELNGSGFYTIKINDFTIYFKNANTTLGSIPTSCGNFYPKFSKGTAYCSNVYEWKKTLNVSTLDEVRKILNGNVYLEISFPSMEFYSGSTEVNSYIKKLSEQNKLKNEFKELKNKFQADPKKDFDRYISSAQTISNRSVADEELKEEAQQFIAQLEKLKEDNRKAEENKQLESNVSSEGNGNQPNDRKNEENNPNNNRTSANSPENNANSGYRKNEQSAGNNNFGKNYVSIDQQIEAFRNKQIMETKKIEEQSQYLASQIGNIMNQYYTAYVRQQQFNERISGLTNLDMEEMDPTRLLDQYYANMEELRTAYKEQISQVRQASSINQLGMMTATNLEQYTQSAAGLIASEIQANNLEKARKKKLKELEENLQEQMTKIKNEVQKSNKEAMDECLHNMSYSILASNENFFKRKFEYHKCCFSEIEKNFSYDDDQWIRTSCREIRGNPVREPSGLKDENLLLEAARRKISMYNNNSIWTDPHNNFTQQQQEMLHSAKAFLGNVLALNNKNAEAYYLRGTIVPNPVDAMVDIRTAYQIDPNTYKKEYLNARNGFIEVFYKAIATNDEKFVQYSMKHYLHLGIQKDQVSPIQYSIRHDRENILRMLIDGELNPKNTIQLNGNNYLFYAVENNALKCFRQLEKYKVDIRYADPQQGMTAFLYSLLKRSKTIAEYLFEHPLINPSESLETLKDPKYANERKFLCEIIYSQFMRDISNEDCKKFSTYILLNYPNYLQNNGFSPVHACISSGRTKWAAYLLSQVTDINLKNENGESPLYLAIKNENFYIASLLIKKGAKIENKGPKNPLELARNLGNERLINLLSEPQADFEILEKYNFDKTLPCGTNDNLAKSEMTMDNVNSFAKYNNILTKKNIQENINYITLQQNKNKDLDRVAKDYLNARKKHYRNLQRNNYLMLGFTIPRGDFAAWQPDPNFTSYQNITGLAAKSFFQGGFGSFTLDFGHIFYTNNRRLTTPNLRFGWDMSFLKVNNFTIKAKKGIDRYSENEFISDERGHVLTIGSGIGPTILYYPANSNHFFTAYFKACFSFIHYLQRTGWEIEYTDPMGNSYHPSVEGHKFGMLSYAGFSARINQRFIMGVEWGFSKPDVKVEESIEYGNRIDLYNFTKKLPLTESKIYFGFTF